MKGPANDLIARFEKKGVNAQFMDEATAKEELRALGIQKPSPDLIKNWIRSKAAEEELEQARLASRPVPTTLAPTAVQPPTAIQADNSRLKKRPPGYSKSNLEPTLREQGALQRQRGPRQPGRPRIIASWFPGVAQSMADGKSLKEALKQHGITLEQRQIRALYRNEEFRKLCREQREINISLPTWKR